MRILEKKTFWVRVIIALFLIILYTRGRKLPLPLVDVAACRSQQTTPEFFWMNATGAFSAGYSLFALGIMPYVWGNMIVLLADAILNAKRKRFISPRKKNHIMLIAVLAVAVPMSLNKAASLPLQLPKSVPPSAARAMIFLLMLLGVLVMIALCRFNAEYGMGGQTILIMVNISETLTQTISGSSRRELPVFLPLALLFVVVELVMENCELRLPLLRVSVHNTHAKENYLAIKWNPVGVMPMIFASVVLTLPALLLRLLLLIFPHREGFERGLDQMNLSRPTGVILYAVAIFLMEYLFAALVLRVRDQVDTLLQTGDCIEGVHPGKETMRYLKKRVTLLATMSAAVMCACVLAPILVGRSRGMTNDRLLSLPSVCTIFACMWGTLLRELTAAWKTAHYRAFTD